MENFENLGLKSELLKAIGDLGFETPSPIQEKVIPVILSKSEDLVALAQTGTGKTAAFGLPLLQMIDTNTNDVQVLVLSPTRELCMQIGSDMQKYSKYMKKAKVICVYGGTDIRKQIKEIKRGVHILVATPGRLCDLINRKAISVENIKWVVLDEADEMLNMGFKEDLNYILEYTPKERKTFLFSATMPREVERIAKNYLHGAEQISVGKKNQGADTVSHIYYQVRAKDCYEALHRIIDCKPDMYAIIFTRTRMDARDISRKLQKDGIDCDALHGDLSQAQRDDVMMQFRSKRLKVLVATDVAARGLDVDSLTHVINYNLPDDVESYTHRSGRTGRAGKEGISVAIINSREKGKVRRIEKNLNKKFEYKDVPNGEEVCSAQLNYYADKLYNTESKDTLEKYEQALFEKFDDLSKEDLIKKMMSYEFGKLLKKYSQVNDLNLSADDRTGNRNARDNSRFTLFQANVGRDDGLRAGDVMSLINQFAPRKGMDIGGIRIFENLTKFEVDVTGVADFVSYFKTAEYQGLPFVLTQLEEVFSREGEDRGSSRRGGRRDSSRGSRDGGRSYSSRGSRDGGRSYSSRGSRDGGRGSSRGARDGGRSDSRRSSSRDSNSRDRNYSGRDSYGSSRRSSGDSDRGDWKRKERSFDRKRN